MKKKLLVLTLIGSALVGGSQLQASEAVGEVEPSEEAELQSFLQDWKNILQGAEKKYGINALKLLYQTPVDSEKKEAFLAEFEDVIQRYQPILKPLVLEAHGLISEEDNSFWDKTSGFNREGSSLSRLKSDALHKVMQFQNRALHNVALRALSDYGRITLNPDYQEMPKADQKDAILKLLEDRLDKFAPAVKAAGKR